jgi:hypothetical protein
VREGREVEEVREVREVCGGLWRFGRLEEV